VSCNAAPIAETTSPKSNGGAEFDGLDQPEPFKLDPSSLSPSQSGKISRIEGNHDQFLGNVEQYAGNVKAHLGNQKQLRGNIEESKGRAAELREFEWTLEERESIFADKGKKAEGRVGEIEEEEAKLTQALIYLTDVAIEIENEKTTAETEQLHLEEKQTKLELMEKELEAKQASLEIDQEFLVQEEIETENSFNEIVQKEFELDAERQKLELQNLQKISK
jgi:hypothetical protein